MNVVFVILYKANMTMIIETNEFASFVLQIICLTNLLGYRFFAGLKLVCGVDLDDGDLWNRDAVGVIVDVKL